MDQHEVSELAAILVNEHGQAALRVAERRRAQYAHEPRSDLYRLWGRIVAATARLLQSRQRREAG